MFCHIITYTIHREENTIKKHRRLIRPSILHIKKNIVFETIKQTEQFAVAERDMRLLTRTCKFILLFIIQEEKDEEEETCST